MKEEKREEEGEGNDEGKQEGGSRYEGGEEERGRRREVGGRREEEGGGSREGKRVEGGRRLLGCRVAGEGQQAAGYIVSPSGVRQRFQQILQFERARPRRPTQGNDASFCDALAHPRPRLPWHV
jgi:hypothetical protein